MQRRREVLANASGGRYASTHSPGGTRQSTRREARVNAPHEKYASTHQYASTHPTAVCEFVERETAKALTVEWTRLRRRVKVRARYRAKRREDRRFCKMVVGASATWS